MLLAGLLLNRDGRPRAVQHYRTIGLFPRLLLDSHARLAILNPMALVFLSHEAVPAIME